MGCYRVISGEAKTPAQTLITVISCQAKVQAHLPQKTKDLDWLTLRVWEMFLDRVPQQKGRLILELRK